MTRKAPSVVRHRSELAVSLNNLGVAYCRASGRPMPMRRSNAHARCWPRWPDDYPDQLAYSSSWAALVE